MKVVAYARGLFLISLAFGLAKPLKPVLTKSDGTPRFVSWALSEIAFVLAVPSVPTSANTFYAKSAHWHY